MFLLWLLWLLVYLALVAALSFFAQPSNRSSYRWGAFWSWLAWTIISVPAFEVLIDSGPPTLFYNVVFAVTAGSFLLLHAGGPFAFAAWRKKRRQPGLA